jgi:hypothetical protein
MLGCVDLPSYLLTDYTRALPLVAWSTAFGWRIYTYTNTYQQDTMQSLCELKVHANLLWHLNIYYCSFIGCDGSLLHARASACTTVPKQVDSATTGTGTTARQDTGGEDSAVIQLSPLPCGSTWLSHPASSP